MPDGKLNTQVILCWPADRAAIDDLNARVRPSEKFEPTVEHTVSDCDGCKRTIWIAPQQLDLWKSPFVAARKVCLYCAADIKRGLNLLVRQVDLNPDIHTAQPRLA